MKGGCTYLWETEGLCKTFHGFVDSEVFRESINGTTSNRRYDQLRYVINDLSAIEGHSLTAVDFQYLAVLQRVYHPVSPGVKVAFVTEDPRIIDALEAAKARQSIAPHHVARVFVTLDEAKLWTRGILVTD